MRRKPQHRKPKKKAAAKRPVRLAGIRDVMAALNLSKVHVGRLVSAGLPPLARGHYDLDACRDWYIRYLQGLVQRHETEDADGNTSSTSDERRRVLRNQAELLEIELAQKRGLLVPLQVFVSRMTDLVVVIRQRVLALESRLGPLVQPEDRYRIREELHRALTALARYEGTNHQRSDGVAEPQPISPTLAVSQDAAAQVESLGV